MHSPDIAIPPLSSRSIEKTLAFCARLGFVGDAFPGHDDAIVEHAGPERPGAVNRDAGTRSCSGPLTRIASATPPVPHAVRHASRS